jgi:HK97 family phage major capsid protein
MSATDALLARLSAESDDRGRFIDKVVEDAQKEQRDLTAQELELVTRSRERIGELAAQIEPLQDAARIAGESRDRTAAIALELRRHPDAPPDLAQIEYRTAGDYIADFWKANAGVQESKERLAIYHRAAAHQTTADNPGLLPEKIVGPVVNFIDAARPLVAALGPRQLPGATWSRPKVTQHTSVDAQSAEKGELVSQKMVIGKVPVTAKTWGGYVNVSRQDIDWSQPGIMDIIIGDLAAQYAIQTENDAVDGFVAAATAGPVIATGAPTAAAVAAAIWTAVGQVYAGAKGQGRVIGAIPPQMLGLIGPLFAPVNPQNAQSAGFNAGDFGSGLAGSISGVPFYCTPAMADNTALVLSTACAEVYEDRIGSLQVVEPSVLGVQVAYAGYFAKLALEPLGIIKITKTP